MDSIETHVISDSDVIVFKYNAESKPPMEDVTNTYYNLKALFPNNTVVCIPEGTSLDAFPKDELIRQLQEMIDYVSNDRGNE